MSAPDPDDPAPEVERPPDRSEPDPGQLPDRVDYDPAYDTDAPVLCDICGAIMHYTASCKIICRNCGYTRDCSDP